MSNGFLQSFALVNCSNQDTGTSKLVTSNNVSKVETAPGEGGDWLVFFETSYISPPAVFVQQAFNGGSDSNLNSVTEDLGYAGGYPSDNAVVVWVTTDQCLVRTGGDQKGYWRSFSLYAIGTGAD